jgi:hypothetical protein
MLAPVPASFAARPVTPALNPPPPSFETCQATGGGTICQGARTQSYGPVDTGVACGSGASAFDILDQATFGQRAIRYYDRTGNLTRRVIYEDYTFGQFSNPLTGAVVPYTQHNTTTDVLAVPGDLGSATETTTGENNYTVPHLGAVFLNAGKTVFGADGSLEYRAGPQNFLDYFVNGDASVIKRALRRPRSIGAADLRRIGRPSAVSGEGPPFFLKGHPTAIPRCRCSACLLHPPSHEAGQIVHDIRSGTSSDHRHRCHQPAAAEEMIHVTANPRRPSLSCKTASTSNRRTVRDQ